MRLGASHLGDGRTSFLVWASKRQRMELLVEGRALEMEPAEHGYFQLVTEDVPPGTRYRYRLDGELERPDPASRFQPEDVHGPSEVVDPDFPWTDHDWHGLPLRDYVLYELHVGTFTSDGTFDAAIERLDELAALGITAVELMPIAEFPGGRNWGYDGVFPFAAESAYGGPDGFRRFVDACHARGMAIALDVVYNHLGPEGAYQSEFAHYFTGHYTTPWGRAVNFDGARSDEVRRYWIENALYWVDDCHVDALRLDAVHAIFDRSATHFLAELAAAVHERADELNRRIHVIAESDLNDPRLVRVPEVGGYGLDGQWVDDFHHALHATLTKESSGYYADFRSVAQLAAAMRQGYVYTGQRSTFRRRRHGAPTTGLPAKRFVVYSQNHDQVGNRMEGDRLAALVPFPALKLAAATVLLSPYVPLLWMGQEYAETAPFLYFISHSDPGLVKAVREGRKEEFAAFSWAGEPPDPQAEETFRRSRLNHELKTESPHAEMLPWYQRLLEARRSRPALSGDRDAMEVVVDERRGLLAWRRWTERDAQRSEALVAVNFGEAPETWLLRLPVGTWEKLLDSGDKAFGGQGDSAPSVLTSEGEVSLSLPPQTAVVYELTAGGSLLGERR